MKKIFYFSLLGLMIFLLFWTAPPVKDFGTIKIWDRNNILLYEKAGNVGKKIPVTYNQLPKHLISAVIVTEDQSFWTNPGIDIKAILRSLILNLKERKIISGASTITQQLARVSIISPQKTPSLSFIRKIREILIALRLNAVYSKKSILTMYLNQMYFGNLSYGVQSAALTYFAKDVSQLSLAESAFLVGLLSSPDRGNTATSITQAKKQQEFVLDQMEKRSLIFHQEAQLAKYEQLSLGELKTDIRSPHFIQYILQNIDNLGVSPQQGVNIYTTLDYPLYALSLDIASQTVEKLGRPHDLTNAALILIKNETGEILSMLGGINYNDATTSGAVNMAVSPRQPGSALKPVTYAAAFIKGYQPATLIYDVKKVYQTKKGEGFTPNNYDGKYHGLILAREALASSLNLPAVEILDKVGLDNILKLSQKMGISTFKEVDRYDLSLTLGGGEVTLLELTNVYATFARGGIYKTPFAINKITTDNGQLLYTNKKENGFQVLGDKGQQIAYLITDILRDPKARIPAFGEKNPLVLSHPAAVKTGTTTDWHDNWTIGYTPAYTVGVWVGNNNNHPMRDVTGIVGAAPIWNQFFEELLKGKTREEFNQPEGMIEVEICKLSGKLTDGICPERIKEIFIQGTQPKDISNTHQKIKIDKRNNLLAGDSCPKNVVLEKIFIDYPPEVYSWAVENNQEVIPQDYSPLCLGDIKNNGQSFLEIVYPKEKTVFENAPSIVANQNIVFEVNVSGDIQKVIWYVDNSIYKEAFSFPFKISWPPKIGHHQIKAKGLTTAGKLIESNDVNIEVMEYNGND